MKKVVAIALTAITLILIAGAAFAVPRLQTYIVGSKYYRTYDIDRTAWITNNRYFDLKVVGYWRPFRPNVSGWNDNFLGCNPGQPRYDYMDTYVVITVPKGQSGHVWINGVEVSTFTDYFNAVPDGVNPRRYLRYHRPARFGKFNFTEAGRIDNDQVNAWHYNHGRIMRPGWGDEILLNVVVSGYDWVHFDAVGVNSRGRTFTNPPSYDASYFATPEPGTLSLLGLGLLGVVPLLRRKK